MKKVGEVQRTHSFVFEDGTYTFHTTNNGRTFRADINTWPSVRAAAKDIRYTLLLNSTALEIAEWLESHPHLPVRKVVESENGTIRN